MTLTLNVSETIALPTGQLTLTVDNGPPLETLCDFAARANPKRGFLIVSKVLGRHLPAAPGAMRETMRDLAAKLPADLPQPVVFLGMAETATALGQGIFAAYLDLHPGCDAIYLQTSRQRVANANVMTSFEEGHSHATTHLIQIADPHLEMASRNARTLVIVDDECSTGKTYVAAAESMSKFIPNLRAIETCCITDWSGGSYIPLMPKPTTGHAILHGSMEWEAGTIPNPNTLAQGSNTPGTAPQTGMRSRSGLRTAETALRSPISAAPNERVLVLGDGEHSYEALLVAEEVQAQGGIAAVQCITRSPALQGHAMNTRSTFTDAYGSGAPCFLYNILGHKPDRIMIVTEIEENQQAEAKAALAELGADLPVDIIVCSYAPEKAVS
ncbi:phosphoribosyltransferase domain-containing protein [Sphingobium aromaticiconvertens]|uniref:phosphoribosyltransferase domain-containing protein n=1 Tax=Sphingobium aromaticiconvertens TaxID=365341 RepID=UPI00301AE8E1